MVDFTLPNQNKKMNPDSYLKIIFGPMWSGKSTEVIKIYKHNCIAQISTLVINYEEDKRYDNEKLSTHDKVMIPCERYTNLTDLLKLSNLDFYKCIVIDEAQFFNDLYVVVQELLKEINLFIFVV